MLQGRYVLIPHACRGSRDVHYRVRTGLDTREVLTTGLPNTPPAILPACPTAPNLANLTAELEATTWMLDESSSPPVSCRLLTPNDARDLHRSPPVRGPSQPPPDRGQFQCPSPSIKQPGTQEGGHQRHSVSTLPLAVVGTLGAVHSKKMDVPAFVQKGTAKPQAMTPGCQDALGSVGARLIGWQRLDKVRRPALLRLNGQELQTASGRPLPSYVLGCEVPSHRSIQTLHRLHFRLAFFCRPR